jgi:DNA gyrase inhibitor GyrI
MADEITQKHLDHARVRGAPSTIPGATGLVGTYDIEEHTRQTVRALVMPLERDFTVPQLKSAQEKLSQTAAKQSLRVLEQPLIALKADPMEDPPGDWEWELVLPVRGRVMADEEAGITPGRIHGGMYVETHTPKGFKDLRSVYMYCLGRFLPAHKQQLTRPLIYHRVLDGLETGRPDKLTLAIYFPIQLSLKPPVQLVTRETMT